MYTSLLAKGNYGAMDTEYAEQTFVTQITSRLPDVYGQAKYEVQWSDTVMENKYVTKHLEAYGKLGYHPVDQQPQGETHTRVRWSPRAEPQSTLFQQENWIQLLEEYEARHPLAPLRPQPAEITTSPTSRDRESGRNQPKRNPSKSTSSQSARTRGTRTRTSWPPTSLRYKGAYTTPQPKP